MLMEKTLSDFNFQLTRTPEQQEQTRENDYEALELENKKLKETIEELKKDAEILREDNAVGSMLFLDFKERMKLKYLLLF